MYLKRIGIINYKSCQSIYFEPTKNDPNTFIGINDAGKSAILKALGLLLDPKMPFSVTTEARLTSDISNSLLPASEVEKVFSLLDCPVFKEATTGCTIVGEFAIEDQEIKSGLLESGSTQFQWAIECKDYTSVVFLRHFENSNAVGKYFYCQKDNESYPALWSKKATDLQAIRKEIILTPEEINNTNNKGRFASIEILRAVYNKVGSQFTWAEAPTFLKADIQFFPTYQYIDWNTSLKNIESLANDVMKAKIETSKTKLFQEALTLSETATSEVNKEFEALTKELTKDLKNIKAIKAKVNFSVNEEVSDITINKTTSDGEIRLESQGEGVKRQILFAFLKWASMRNVDENDSTKKFIWCFDEPEAHLYPAAQRELSSVISDLAKGNHQVFIGTHSTIFVDRLRLDEIYKVRLSEKYSEILTCSSVDDIHESLGVRNSDILFFDKFLAVEGECEEILVPHFYKVMTGNTLEQDSIKLVPLGGEGQYLNNKRLFESILSDFKKTESVVHYIFDADTAHTGTNVSLLGKCDIEDAISNSQWITLVQNNCGVILSEGDLDNIRAKIIPTNSATKFHKLLADFVQLDAGHTGYLPSKKDCAEILRTQITDESGVPKSVQDAFSQILTPQALMPHVVT